MLNFREKTFWIHVSTQDVTLSLMGDLDLRHPKFNALRFVYLWLTLGLHLPRGCRFWMKAWASFHTLFNGFWVLKAPKGVPKSFFLTSTVTYTYLLAYVLVETCLLNNLLACRTCLDSWHVFQADMDAFVDVARLRRALRERNASQKVYAGAVTFSYGPGARLKWIWKDS